MGGFDSAVVVFLHLILSGCSWRFGLQYSLTFVWGGSLGCRDFLETFEVAG